MSAQNPDPEDDNITGLEPGGGVPPGETPPGESSMGAPQGHDEHGPKKGFSAVWLAVIGVMVVLVFILIIGNIIPFF
ncbi:DUF6480 family protein [Arthrobacter sp. Br18]|uniref:DUF6480 family protein n=1 Tax=Arthrobacter sp. Br18 TaxID=1312954 RepID=UPI00047DD9F9|nr:DUF6480 family protein [Arthrobacter sp. Br18]